MRAYSLSQTGKLAWALAALLVACGGSAMQPAGAKQERTKSTQRPSTSRPSTSRPAASRLPTIDRLVKKLSSQPLWSNGTAPKITLPKTAPSAKVVAEVFRRVSFTQGRVKSHRVIETRTVQIGGDRKPYIAVLVKTNLGRKIVLLRHEQNWWWSRVY